MELPSVYDPQTTESKWYDFWEARGLFGSRPDPARKPFAVVIPPPNVTGSLHMGHALNSTVQDTLVRWRRMRGDNALWIPGTDHGGIATQNVVEKQLKQEGKTRHDLGREKFLERMWEWRRQSGDAILHQLRKLGAACDWTRTRFTMDEPSSRAVARAFVELFRRGLIYRGFRLVNWCARCGTSLSDIEVEHQDSKGKLWRIRYPFKDGGDVVVATTRPETMLGDTAVAVNPEDPRYAGRAGQKLVLPLVGREIPLVEDAAVDPAFGTGAVKVTPSHDAVDFEIGARHGLPHEMVIGYDGRMTERAGKYAGQSLKDCRKNVLADLEAGGFLVQEEDYKHSVAVCYRCSTAIEPLESSQWFVKTGDMARRAAEATESGAVKIFPESWAKPYLHWLRNNKDWCVSRQIWWGHRIPVWYCPACLPSDAADKVRADPDFKLENTKSLLREKGRPVAAEQKPASCPDCGGTDMVQDPDVLDTWFSSGLWPLTTLGWPDETSDLSYYYPTAVLATGHEILYLWVARMVMMGLELKGDIPYRHVFIHGIVRDKHGKKMSKSLNNVIDPLDVMKKYGADALRFALLSSAVPGRDMQLADDGFVGARNFANKIWNASRFVLTNLADHKPADIPLEKRDLADRWILAKLRETVAAAGAHLENYDLAQAARALYQFFWGDFCDWYIELAKIRLMGTDPAARRAAQQTLAEVLDASLRALHPLMPFLTEELWQALTDLTGDKPAESLMAAPWPAPGPDPASPADRRNMDTLQAAVTAVRIIRSEMNVPPGKTVPLLAAGPDGSPAKEVLTSHAE
ncbi:MAG: valine--tRNA ligase, partial [Elusimicrobiota bacterium]